MRYKYREEGHRPSPLTPSLPPSLPPYLQGKEHFPSHRQVVRVSRRHIKVISALNELRSQGSIAGELGRKEGREGGREGGRGGGRGEKLHVR